ncbi:GntR family transcriptional regulator [Candidatus Bipolaricaulota sp. J31]
MKKKLILPIDRGSPLPIYHQLKEALKEQIESGVLKPHERVPSERELEEMYRISRMTARRALEELEAEGYIYRAQGKGSFVAEPKIRQGLLWLTSFTEDMQERGMRAGARVLEVKVVKGDEKLARRLRASPSEEFVKVQRLRLADDEPMALETSFLRRRFCPGLEEFDFTNRSLYKTLQEKYGLRLGRAEQTVEAKVADEFEAELLGVKPGTPMLAMERVTYLDDGQTPIEYVRSVYRGDRYKLYVELRRR